MKKKIKTVFKKIVNPNSWGRQGYEGKSLPNTRNQRLDKSRPNSLDKMAFVQRIMTKYVTGYPKGSI